MLPEPSVDRPRFPAVYGIARSRKGLLEWSWATERLARSRNYWVATSSPHGPHAVPVWGLWLDDGLYFGTSPESRTGRALALDPRVCVHLESGDEVVILEGEAEPYPPDERTAAASKEKYGFAGGDGGSEGSFRLRPRLAYAWLESDLGRTATRFTFDS